MRSDTGYIGLGVLLGVEAAIPEAPDQAEWTYYKLHNDLVQMQVCTTSSPLL